MGACYSGNFISDPASDTPRSEAELKSHFREEQEIDRYENGHMYSGGIGMAEGQTIKDGSTVQSALSS